MALGVEAIDFMKAIDSLVVNGGSISDYMGKVIGALFHVAHVFSNFRSGSMESGSPQNTRREITQADVEKMYKELW